MAYKWTRKCHNHTEWIGVSFKHKILDFKKFLRSLDRQIPTEKKGHFFFTRFELERIWICLKLRRKNRNPVREVLLLFPAAPIISSLLLVNIDHNRRHLFIIAIDWYGIDQLNGSKKTPECKKKTLTLLVLCVFARYFMFELRLPSSLAKVYSLWNESLKCLLRHKSSSLLFMKIISWKKIITLSV